MMGDVHMELPRVPHVSRVPLTSVIISPSCSRRLSVKQTRVLQMDEDVLCVRYSPDGRLLAVSLLDCTVKIFFVDTLKVRPGLPRILPWGGHIDLTFRFCLFSSSSLSMDTNCPSCVWTSPM